MPLFKRAQISSKFESMPNLSGVSVEIRYEEGDESFGASLPVRGEITQSFEIADAPSGWHLVWLDEAIEYKGEPQAYLIIAARWVARPIAKGGPAPINIRLVPDVAKVEKGAPDIDALPFVAKGLAVIL